MNDALMLAKIVLADTLLVIAMLGGICYLYIAFLVWLRLLQRKHHSFAKYTVAAGISIMLSGVSLTLVAFLLQPYVELLGWGLVLSFLVALLLAGGVGSPGFWINRWSRQTPKRK